MTNSAADAFLQPLQVLAKTKLLSEGQTALTKLIRHTHRLMSFILHSPQERYAELVAQQSHLLQRIAQHHLASYLGITPMSLSRIRRRK